MKSVEAIWYLKAHGCEFDIMKKASVELHKNRKWFENAKRELERESNGHVAHRAEISPECKYNF